MGGLENLVGSELLGNLAEAGPIILLVLSVVMFAGAMLMNLQAMQSFRNNRQIGEEMQAQFRTVQDLSVEVRQLTKKVETAADYVATHEPDQRQHTREYSPVRVGARDDTDEADISLRDDDRQVMLTNADEVQQDKGTRARLDAAKKAAAVPSSILRSFRRR